MAGFSLIVEDTLYKKVISTSGGYYDRGVWYSGEETITYDAFDGIVDPYNDSETSLTLESGVSNEDALLLYTDEDLTTHVSLDSGSGLADIIYLDNPDEDDSLDPYTVYEKSGYSKNANFKLIDSKHYEYLLIRANRT